MKTPPLLFWLVAGCSGLVPGALPPDAQSSFEAHIAAFELRGTLVYTGRVRPRGTTAPPLYAYRRMVYDDGAEQVSGHLTRRMDDDAPLVLHETRTTPEARLLRFDEWHGQTGLVGSVTVDAAATATFDVTVGDRRIQRTERGDDPVHAGPSLFGFVRRHWDALLAGERVPLRFAVLANGRTYRFAVRLDAANADRARFRIDATDALVRLAVPSMRLVFDAEHRAPLRYEGLVPPYRETPRALRAFDARVDYTPSGSPYR